MATFNVEMLGTQGIAGAAGKTILNGSGAPDDTDDGVDGDFYIDTDNNDFYGPKTSGAWGSATSITAGISDHGSLSGLTDDDHSQYALADGTRGDFATTAQGDLADTAIQPGDLGTAATADTGDFATAAQGTLADSATQPGDLGAVATSNDYDDLDNLPTLGTAAAAATTDFATGAEGDLAATAVQPGDLGAVATSNDYDDLDNLPTLGTAAAANTGDFATGAEGDLAATATQPGDLATVATTGDYDDLTDKPTLGTAAAAATGDFATAAQGTTADAAVPSVTTTLSALETAAGSSGIVAGTRYFVTDVDGGMEALGKSTTTYRWHGRITLTQAAYDALDPDYIDGMSYEIVG